MFRLNWTYISLLLSVFPFCSCQKDKEQSEIPDVSFRTVVLDMRQAKYSILRSPGQFIEIEYRDNGYPVGYAGLIVGQSTFPGFDNEPQYLAYDRACQVEGARRVAVNIVEDGLGYAECPQCHARYDLNNYGMPVSGSRLALKHYHAEKRGNDMIYVTGD